MYLIFYGEVGLWLYMPFIRGLVAHEPDVGILAIELIPISNRMTSPLLPRTENCLNISRIINSLDIPKFVLVSHSYGTILATHVLKSPSLSPRMAASVLIDPIPFLLHLPNVAFNFVYRTPRYANEWILWFYASRDPDISRALSRHFFWAENVLWKEDLDGDGEGGTRKRKTAVVLGGADQIVHAQEVRKYLTGEEEAKLHWKRDDGGLEVLFFPELDHGKVMDTKKRRKRIYEVIERFVEELDA
jgi:pimeloyl-ACP methyl ester carboxylesterase